MKIVRDIIINRDIEINNDNICCMAIKVIEIGFVLIINCI